MYGNKESKEIFKKIKKLQKDYYANKKDNLYFEGKDKMFYINETNQRIYGKLGESYFFTENLENEKTNSILVSKNVKCKGNVSAYNKDSIVISVNIKYDAFYLDCNKKGKIIKLDKPFVSYKTLGYVELLRMNLKTINKFNIKEALKSISSHINEAFKKTEYNEIDWIIENRDYFINSKYDNLLSKYSLIDIIKKNNYKNKEVVDNQLKFISPKEYLNVIKKKYNNVIELK